MTDFHLTWRQCSRCPFRAPIDEFPLTFARGRLYRRRWCRACLLDYYTARRREKKRLREATP